MICEHGHEHEEGEFGTFDLVDLAELIRHGKPWQEAIELGLVEDAGENTWRVSAKGARLGALFLLLDMEIAEADIEGEKEQGEWRSHMFHGLGKTVLAMAARGLLHEEMKEAFEKLKSRSREVLKESSGKPELPEWVELN